MQKITTLERIVTLPAKRRLYSGNISTVQRFSLSLEENPGRLEMIHKAIHGNLGQGSVINHHLIDMPGEMSPGYPPTNRAIRKKHLEKAGIE